MNALVTSDLATPAIDHYERTILLVYQRYSSEGRIDEKIFDQATKAFNQLEHLYREPRNTPSPLPQMNPSVPIQSNLATMRKYINAMHSSIPHLTRRDLQLFQSFFQRSPEKYYICPNGIKYHQPDHSHLLNMAGALFTANEYTNMGLSKCLHLLHPITKKPCPCSVLRIRKHPDQPDLFASYAQNHTPEQALLFSKLIKTLPKLVQEWDYDCYYPCRGTESASFGISPQDPEELYMLLFFYKECDAPQERNIDYVQRAKEITEQIKNKEAKKQQSLFLKILILYLCIRKILYTIWNKLTHRGMI